MVMEAWDTIVHDLKVAGAKLRGWSSRERTTDAFGPHATPQAQDPACQIQIQSPTTSRQFTSRMNVDPDHITSDHVFPPTCALRICLKALLTSSLSSQALSLWMLQNCSANQHLLPLGGWISIPPNNNALELTAASGPETREWELELPLLRAGCTCAARPHLCCSCRPSLRAMTRPPFETDNGRWGEGGYRVAVTNPLQATHCHTQGYTLTTQQTADRAEVTNGRQTQFFACSCGWFRWVSAKLIVCGL